MTGKTEKRFFVETRLNWLNDQHGILSGRDTEGILHITSSPKFDGEGELWTPEQLFLGSISSCFMTTFLAFAKQFDFDITDFECVAIGEIKFEDGKQRFTGIDLYPKVNIPGENLRDKATHALEKTHQWSLVSSAVGVEIFYHSEILVGAPAGYIKMYAI